MSSSAIPVLGVPDGHDIWLSPHTDDICFSLGALASRRQTGQLLTVFPLSRYQARGPQGQRAGVRDTSVLRIREDARFARACGLMHRTLDFADSSARGRPWDDVSDVEELARTLGVPLMRALMGPGVGRRLPRRPWLFAPCGIGGHVDHRAILLAVTRRLPELGTQYRIAFYEDLHYASDPKRRDAGLLFFRGVLRGRAVLRMALELDASEQARKMQLVHLYASQLTADHHSIAAFTPADPATPGPHEGLWVLQGDMHQAPG
jgi:LmbE family N-acetylglucosaminyl deacetylase